VHLTDRRACACVAALIGSVSLAVVSSAMAQHTATHKRATRGIARAARAGILIDPSAKAIMAAAPVGSCLNDPAQSKCGNVNAVVNDGQLEADGSTGYSSLATLPATVALYRPVHHRATAHAAAVDQCHVRATSLVKSTGSARAYGQNTCTDAVTWQQLFVNLREFWKSDSSWHQMDTGASPVKYGGGSVNTNASMPCRSAGVRAWQDQASGYDEMQGVLYAGQNSLYKNLPLRRVEPRTR
jgi:hypothetical protein